MDPLHAVYLTVGLFVMTFLIREPIFLWWYKPAWLPVDAQVLTGLGVALGDAFLFRVGFVWSCDTHYAV